MCSAVVPSVGHDAAVTTGRYADRLHPATYADNDGVVGVFEFRRLVLIATGYELHTLPLLAVADPVRLNRTMCESLADEVAFVAERVANAPPLQTAQRLSDYVATRPRRPSWDGPLTVEHD
jgi:hypothetical protein